MAILKIYRELIPDPVEENNQSMVAPYRDVYHRNTNKYFPDCLHLTDSPVNCRQLDPTKNRVIEQQIVQRHLC